MMMNDIRSHNTKRGRPGFTLIEILLAMGIFSTTLLIVINIFVSSSRLQQRAVVGQRMTGDARYTIETMARAVRSGIVDYNFYADPLPVDLSPYDLPDSARDIGDSGRPHHILATIDQDGNRTIFRRVSLDRENDPWGVTMSTAGDGKDYYNVGDQVEVCFETSICVDPDGLNDPDIYESSSKESCNVECVSANEECLLSCEFASNWSNITPEGARLTGGINHPDEPYGLNFTIRPVADPNRFSNSDYLSDQQPIVTIMLMTRGTGDSIDSRKTTFIQTAAASRVYQR